MQLSGSTNKRAYGIDLGTTYSAIAFVNDHNEPEIIPDQDNGTDIMASAVYINEDGTIIVGDNAKEKGMMQPERLMQFFKRWIGLNDRKDREIYSVDGKEYDPVQLSAMVLRKIKDTAQKFGHNVEDVVITCPACFCFTQMEATKKAAQIAGMNVLDIINEPTAAAMCYCHYRRFYEDQTVLVYDLGGGTFDVTLLRVSAHDRVHDIQVIATAGDPMLGGKDWDHELLLLLKEKYNECYNGKPGRDLEFEMQGAVEKLKNMLSYRSNVISGRLW